LTFDSYCRIVRIVEPTHTGLRERKKRATRSALIAAAVRLFGRRGFDAVTIDEICAAIDVSPRTFFRYFGAKEHIVLHDVDVYKDAFSAALRAPRPGESARVTARRAAVAVAREIAARRDDLRPRLLLISQSPLLVATWADLDRFWREHLVVLFEAAGERDADLLAGAVVGGLNAALARFLADPREDPETLTRRVFELVHTTRQPRRKKELR
jgi:AcrR family transcriptional regulator